MDLNTIFLLISIIVIGYLIVFNIKSDKEDKEKQRKDAIRRATPEFKAQQKESQARAEAKWQKKKASLKVVEKNQHHWDSIHTTYFDYLIVKRNLLLKSKQDIWKHLIVSAFSTTETFLHQPLGDGNLIDKNILEINTEQLNKINNINLAITLFLLLGITKDNKDEYLEEYFKLINIESDLDSGIDINTEKKIIEELFDDNGNYKEIVFTKISKIIDKDILGGNTKLNPDILKTFNAENFKNIVYVQYLSKL